MKVAEPWMLGTTFTILVLLVAAGSLFKPARDFVESSSSSHPVRSHLAVGTLFGVSWTFVEIGVLGWHVWFLAVPIGVGLAGMWTITQMRARRRRDR
jgi:hypothetical protein